jgi:ATP-dependent Clp protease adaptor protein ClpS
MGEETPPQLKENTMPSTDIQLDEKIKIKVSEPKNWKVILLNDDTTPVDFVVSILMEVFKHSADTAKEVTIQVHETGSGIAGVYSSSASLSADSGVYDIQIDSNNKIVVAGMFDYYTNYPSGIYTQVRNIIRRDRAGSPSYSIRAS